MKWLVFTGAGVSKESGIPTFEELGDLRLKLSRTYFRNNPKDFYEVLNSIYRQCKEASPNAAHLSIAAYGLQVVTMNIDGLHQQAGSENVLQIHGDLNRVYCPSCGKNYPFAVTAHHIKSSCCEKVYEPQVVLYEDQLKDLEIGYEWLQQSDGLLIIGTSFYTSTANYFYEYAQALGKSIEVINADAAKTVPLRLKELLE